MQYESAYLKEELTHAGWRQAADGEMPDVAIINTCIVTQRAAHQSRQAIRKAIRENPNGMVAAIGCYAQVYADELSSIQGIRLIADNRAKGKLIKFILSMADSGQRSVVLKDFELGMPFEFLPIGRYPGRTRAYLKIQDGCESFCSYCIVAFARGPYRSLAPEKVLSIIESLAGEGYREIVLTGIHLGKYGVDLDGNMNLNNLLRAIGREGFPVRIRLSSIEPNEIDQDLIEMVASNKWLCRHFHIPLQSGDNRVLKRMNRHYSGYEFAGLIESIYERIPLAAIGVDVMSGFPGEDPVAHQNTCALIRDLPVSYLHVFPFSPRKGTAAFAFDGRNDPEVIKKRAAELRAIGQDKRTEFYSSCLGKEFPVLAEGWYSEKKEMMKGTSDNYLAVLFSSSNDLKGRIVPVCMERIENNKVFGSPV
ncbi:MAG: tRNA (N(6)-L-threonylcarbamoyladenosine(37)-C(2))-methylthiotransferase MtaB [Deltaproteobacteria bacterium]|nr:tRNA (N(6)-L-threonylcarbamoyladenosine(37)-C(2))-methylthiotransferase MtaB [Deltaproteobacteria bacterium]